VPLAPSLVNERNLAKFADRNHHYFIICKTTVQKVGDELGIVLPLEVLDALGVKEGETLYITQISGNAVRLTSDRPGFAEKMKIAEQCMKRYSNALHELAQ